ncbi:MAG TPA: DUF1003 domain-containing protein [Longimicrobium sp.]|jgi:uncharacterized membrane protein|nr:DUF1003 domain-containing protein [Longimicrobium sp.]
MARREPEISAEERVLLADVIDRNISTMLRLREETARKRTFQAHLADIITWFSGKMLFVYLHVVWFGAWILVNHGLLPPFRPFDPFPYGLLTMIVSLEAIFLSTFVLISQNRLAAEADRRADLDLHIGLLTEHEVTRVLQMLDAVHQKLGIPVEGDSELAQLEMETRPEDVLAEIHRLQHGLRRRRSRDHELAAG